MADKENDQDDDSSIDLQILADQQEAVQSMAPLSPMSDTNSPPISMDVLSNFQGMASDNNDKKGGNDFGNTAMDSEEIGEAVEMLALL